MNFEFVIGALNPAMSAIFAMSLLVLWYQQQGLKYILYFALSYIVRILCFFVLLLAFLYANPYLVQVSNFLILFSTAILAFALNQRIKSGIKISRYVLLLVISCGGLSYYQFVETSLPARALIINITLAIIYLRMMVDVFRSRTDNPIERLLFAQLAFAFAVYLLRPMVLTAPSFSPEQKNAIYWLVVSVTDTLVCSTLAIAVFALIASDVVSQRNTNPR